MLGEPHVYDLVFFLQCLTDEWRDYGFVIRDVIDLPDYIITAAQPVDNRIESFQTRAHSFQRLHVIPLYSALLLIGW